MEKNTLYLGDALELIKELPDKSIDMILTDPPYGISFLSNRTDHQKLIKNDGLEDWSNLMDKILPEMKRVLSDTGCCCCGGGGGKTPVTALFTIKFIEYFNLIQTLVWYKHSFGLGWRYRPQYENILIGSKSLDKYAWYTKRKNISNVLSFGKVIPQKGDHPTTKPVDLMIELLEYHSKPGDVVLDPFAGGGSTLVACADTGRNYIGFELDGDYYKQASEKLIEHDVLNIKNIGIERPKTLSEMVRKDIQ